MAKRQQEFSGAGFSKPGDIFGGSLLKNGNARSKRPLASKFAIHVVLHANKSVMRSLRNFAKVEQTLHDTAKRQGVRLYKHANVGNHTHLLIKLTHIRHWPAFIKELSSRIALICTDEKGFWKWRPFTRIVRGWKRAYQIVKDYIELNQLEANGFIKRKDTKTLKDLRAIFEPS